MSMTYKCDMCGKEVKFYDLMRGTIGNCEDVWHFDWCEKCFKHMFKGLL